MRNNHVKRILCAAGISASMLGALAGCQGNKDNTEAAVQMSETQPVETSSETSSEMETEPEAVMTEMKNVELTDIFESQAGVDEALKKEADNGYSFEAPSVILNPYGTAPLSAVIVFSTEEEMGGTITVKGKSPEDDIAGTIEKAKDHIVPVYGLYNGDTTQVEMILEDGTTNTVEIITEAIELNVGTIEVEMIDSAAYDYTNLTLACSSGGGLYALDSKGDVRWYYASGGTLGVHQLSNGHLMMPTAYTLKGMYYKSGLQEIDLNGKVYNEYAIPGGMHHDFQELSNGNLLVAGDSPDLSTVEDYIVEIDRATGQVVWELDMADLLDKEDGASASNLLDGGEEIDWFHNNSLWYDEANDLLLLSARHVDAIVAIHKKEKSLAWILGDPAGWEKTDKKYFFTPVGENFEWQYAQHQVTMLDNGDIMLFDNGTAKVKKADAEQKVTGDGVYSRAVIYRINTEDMTIEQIFEYGKERGPEWYSDWISGVVSLDGTKDNLWITAGSNLYSEEEDSHDFGPTGMMKEGLVKSTHIDQVTDGALVYEIKISGQHFAALTYRSMRIPFYQEGSELDVEAQPQLLGGLGETAVSDAEVSLDGAKELNAAGWNFTMDRTKLTVAGNYKTDTAADALQEGYLVLKDEEGEIRAYPLTQYGTKSDEGTNVAVTGWVSPTGLEGSSYEIYLIMDGVPYRTGYSVEL